MTEPVSGTPARERERETISTTELAYRTDEFLMRCTVRQRECQHGRRDAIDRCIVCVVEQAVRDIRRVELAALAPVDGQP